MLCGTWKVKNMAYLFLFPHNVGPVSVRSWVGAQRESFVVRRSQGGWAGSSSPFSRVLGVSNTSSWCSKCEQVSVWLIIWTYSEHIHMHWNFLDQSLWVSSSYVVRLG